MSLAPFSGMKPIDSLSDTRRRRLLQQAGKKILPHRFKLNAAAERDYYLYLLDGTVVVKSPEGREQFDGTCKRAKRPIFTDPNLTETAVIQAESRIIKVSKRQYASLREEQAGADDGYEVNDAVSVDLEADVLKKLFDDYQKDRIPVPSMPEAAVRIRQLLRDPDVCIMDLAGVIERDPALAGKLVAASNSALTAGQRTIASVKDALVRLGLKRSCTLVTSVAMKGLFEFSDPKLQETAKEVWHHSLRVAAMARVLAGMSAKTPDPEHAFLVGLLHDIGAVTLLAYFTEHRPASSDFMAGGSLRELCGMVSAMVLQKWAMGGEFVEAAEGAGKWEVVSSDNAYANLINVAKQQAYRLYQPEIEVPEIEKVAAYRSLPLRDVVKDGVFAALVNHPEITAALDGLA